MKPIAVFFLLITFSQQLFCQDIPLGEWRNHAPYNQLKTLEVTSRRVYAASSSNSFFINLPDNSFNPFTKIEGLSSYRISDMAYKEDLKTLVIGYEDGNMDVIADQVLHNLDAIKRSQAMGSKEVNHISFRGHYAYVSTGIGLIVVDLKNKEIKESYLNLGNKGNQIQVYNSTFTKDQDSLFIATEEGIKVGVVHSSINLMDYNNWYTFSWEDDNIPSSNVKAVQEYNGKIYAIFEPGVPDVDNTDSGYLFSYSEGNWQKTGLKARSPVKSLSSSGNKLLVCHNRTISILNESEEIENLFGYWPYEPYEAAYDHKGNLWVADWKEGLLSDKNGNFGKHQPPGILENTAFKVEYQNGMVFSLFGGYNQYNANNWKSSGFAILEERKPWQNYNRGEGNFISTNDIVDVAYNPYDDSLYFCSFSLGLVSWKKGELSYKRYPVSWNPGSTSNVTENGTDISLKNSGTGWAGWAKSSGFISRDGHFGATVAEEGDFILGLSTREECNIPDSLNGKFLFNQDGTLKILSGSDTIYKDGTYSRGQSFRITNHNNELKFFKDDVEIASTNLGNRISKYSMHHGCIIFDGSGKGKLTDPFFNKPTIYNYENSPIQTVAPAKTRGDSMAYHKTGGVEVDSKGNVWVISLPPNQLAPSLARKDLNNNWTSYVRGATPLHLEIDQQDNKWLIIDNAGNRGLIVFQENEDNNTSDDQQRSFTVNDGLPVIRVLSVASDLNGDVWVGTEEGVAIMQNGEDPFDPESNFIKPIFDGYPLLFDKRINVITVDPGNRKWIGTENGVWLFNENGTEVIHRYTTENSPLPGDDIQSIAINEKTGEVFVSTDQGMVSLRSDATEAEPDTYQDVVAFPNPVRKSFSGNVGITGLARDVNVKITDMYGNLVYETDAEGGTATWNVSDYTGRRVKPGVYLIFTGSEEGEETTLVTKIAVVD